jgi:hypothetical protein
MQAAGDLSSDAMELMLGRCSFSPDTKVLLANGRTKAIRDVDIGDVVVATDPGKSRTAGKAVTRLHDNLDTELADLTVVDHRGVRSTLHTTQNHPFWDATTATWTPAAGLHPGDRLGTPAGTTTVADVRSFRGARHMLNLTVAGVHTYYVLAAGTPVLVHNTCPTQHIALGLESEGVDGFAQSLNAEHLMNDKDWRGTVWTAANVLKYDNPGVKVSFKLDGMQGADKGVSSAVGSALTRNARGIGGATDLEIAFFHDAGTLGKVDFYIDGQLQPNPF